MAARKHDPSLKYTWKNMPLQFLEAETHHVLVSGFWKRSATKELCTEVLSVDHRLGTRVFYERIRYPTILLMAGIYEPERNQLESLLPDYLGWETFYAPSFSRDMGIWRHPTGSFMKLEANGWVKLWMPVGSEREAA